MGEKQCVMEVDVAGRRLVLETGKVAKQANGAVMVRYADTVVIVTAVCSERCREGVDFFPLMVDYEEKLYAAGKIPGGFIKREGRPSEKSILTSRLIDRPIRPLFPKGLRNDMQITALVLSSDQENDADIPAIIGASAALAISDIPFPEVIAAVRIGYRDGVFLVNPTYKEREESALNLVVAGTKEDIMMVEAGAEEVSESLLMEALRIGHEEIKKVIRTIGELAGKVGKPKREFPVYQPSKELEALMRRLLTAKVAEVMIIAEKEAHENAMAAINREAFLAILQETMDEEARAPFVELLTDSRNFDFDQIKKTIEEEEFRRLIVEKKIRPDGRTLTEIRPITCEVGILPRTHGSGLFTRGQTQVLNILTLGTMSEEQILDGIGGDESKRYMHQYNFPPFSVGEVKPMRGPGRREIGHGALAERAIVGMIPSVEEFPYALRLVSEVLESNGSTSMASVCASTLALMDAGVKITAPIAGIAMGLVKHGDGFAVLTDIQGLEDFLGDMDFKVAGSRSGVTALQMDIKIKGISFEIMERALAQARDARMFILNKIEECISAPREELSPYAPRIITLMINPDRIKDVIGPGGKMINKIIAETGVKIDIEDDGRVFIAAVNPESGNAARKWIEDLTRDIEIGEIYLGRVSRIMNFGAFVEFLPGKEGLVHISQLSYRRIPRVEDAVKIGDEITVKVIEIDDQGRINLTARGLSANPEENIPPDNLEEGPPRRDRGPSRPRGDRDRGRPPRRDNR
ncbi:MAG: polyribonucleotide nucleotidyltransferase [Candidatus Eremiobacteraeota bacterium]|nr:polyribonucleotide nucleotidyltransferase [Candidatus Eremiobacteraeota bacterium]